MFRLCAAVPITHLCMIGWLLFAAHEPIAFALQPRDDVIAAFKINSYWGTPRIPVSFNGNTYEFLLDTGCSTTNFEPELSMLLVETGRSALVTELDTSSVQTLYRSPLGSIGGISIPPLHSVSCMKSEINPFLAKRVSGLLGSDALTDLIIKVDYDSGQISLLRSVPQDAGAPLDLVGSTGLPTVKGSIGGSECEFVLNTALFYYNSGCIPKRAFDNMVERGDLEVVDNSLVPSRARTIVRRDAVATVPVRVGPHKHGALIFTECEDGERTHNILGIGYLRRYVVTFDFRGRCVYLSPGAQFRRVDAAHDPGGLRLRREGNLVVVSDVWGPALSGGISVGDVLDSIDGVFARALSDVDLARSLSQSKAPSRFIFRKAADGAAIRFVHDEQDARRRSLERANRQAPHSTGKVESNGGN